MAIDIRKFEEMLLDTVPESAQATGGNRGFETAVIEVLKEVPVGKSLTRTSLGKILGMPMPKGTQRVNSTAMKFNAVKNKLAQEGILKETRTGQKGDYEYYYTKLAEFPEADEVEAPAEETPEE